MKESSPSEDDSKSESDYDYEENVRRSKPRVDFITSEVVSTIDAVGVSDYAAARILMAVSQALGYELNDLNVSRSTIRRRRIENRKVIAASVKSNFKVRSELANDIELQ